MKQPWHSHYNAICGDWVAKHNRTTRNGVGNCSSKTGSRRQSEKKDDFEALFKRIFRRKITSAKNAFRARLPSKLLDAAHSNAICGDWVAKHKRTTRNGVGNCSSKTGSRRQSEKKTILKHFLKWFLEGKSLAPKWRKSADKSLSQPSCSHSNTILRSPAAKDNSITHAATAWSNLDAAITMRSAETELQNTRELRAMASEIVAPKPDLDARAKKRRFWSTF